MKNPTSLSQLQQVCPDCVANFKQEIIVHPIEKTYQGKTRYSWGNTDGSGHITKVENDFIHVWSAKEKELARIGGTASLSMHRQNNKPFTDIKKELDALQPGVNVLEPAEPFQYEQLSETDRQSAEVILRQIFELKHLARQVAKDYSPDDQNPASIGQTAKITLDALKAMRDKK